MAAEKGRCEQILRYLVDKGADINIKDKNGVNISRLVLFKVSLVPRQWRWGIVHYYNDSVC